VQTPKSGTPVDETRSAPSVNTQQHVKVAVLLATYNGGKFVDSQIRSLKENATPFTLHWLDDQSTDNTREVVRASALAAGVDLRECHHPQRQGPWIGFYELLERVEADIYLFCDQDDIWQPGKIDVTVANLLPDLGSSALCFSDPLTFNENEPAILRSTYAMMGQKAVKAVQESRVFMSACTFGHTEGFTRPVRELFLKHKDIARAYSMGHDWWMYLIAVSSGTARMLSDVPTTLYRRHGSNFSDLFLVPKGNRIGWIWRLQQMLRRGVSRQAEGFVLASATLPPGPKLDRTLALARLVAVLDRRQSPAAIVRLARNSALWPNWRWAFPFAAACLCSDARETKPPEMVYES
jgi:glycosyltransferase involved in cell wall biosynthesis